MRLWLILEVVDALQDALFGLLPVVGGTAVHIEGSGVGSDDVDDWNLLHFLLGHEANQWPARAHVDKISPADMIGCDYWSCDGLSIVELFLEVEADLEGEPPCVDPEEINNGLWVFEVSLERANDAVGGQKGDHGGYVQRKAEEATLDDFLLVPLAEILAD